MDAELADGRQLGVGLQALGDDLRAGLVGEVDERGGQRPADGVGVDAAGEVAVELDDLGRQLEDVGERGEAGAGVVDRQARAGAAQAAERGAQALVVLDGEVLGQLDDEALGVGARGSGP